MNVGSLAQGPRCCPLLCTGQGLMVHTAAQSPGLFLQFTTSPPCWAPAAVSRGWPWLLCWPLDSTSTFPQGPSSSLGSRILDFHQPAGEKAMWELLSCSQATPCPPPTSLLCAVTSPSLDHRTRAQATGPKAPWGDHPGIADNRLGKASPKPAL